MGSLTGTAPGASPAAPGARRPALVFIGFMGAGKSSAARTAAAELGAAPLDSDLELERALGRSLESFFDEQGEAAFRAREEEMVLALLERADARVVALGGGAVGSARVREALRGHVVVHLEVDPADAWQRASGKGRPLARDRGRFEQLHQDRAELYDALADAVLPPSDRGAVRRALPALEWLRARAAAGAERPRLVWAPGEGSGYPVMVGRGLLRSGAVYPDDRRRFLVADEAVAALHPLPDGPRTAVPGGEREKTLARAEAVLRELARAGATRDDLLLAVGGGVVGDLAGFCAAVYQRGIEWASVPTTLVGQVDSAYGGKTGVDLPEGKNYVGAFHAPSAVNVDPALLETLPAAEVAAGYAEVVKTALIAGGGLWARVREGAAPDDDAVIVGCLRTKLDVVAADERDQGARQVLNLGHTVGHALEAATGYRRLRHGEAVALGLLAALRMSGRDALRAEVAELLAARGLPRRVEGVAVDDVLELVGRDKKRRAGGPVPFVLVEAPGRVTPGHEVPGDALRAAVEEVAGG